MRPPRAVRLRPATGSPEVPDRHGGGHPGAPHRPPLARSRPAPRRSTRSAACWCPHRRRCASRSTACQRTELIRTCAQLRPGARSSAARSTRPRPRCAAWPAATSISDGEIAELDAQIAPLVRASRTARSWPCTARARDRRAAAWPPPGTTLTGSGRRPHSRTCAASPRSLPASGRTHRYRLSRGGDRAANNALHTIVLIRMRHDPRTRAYLARRTAEGLSKKEMGAAPLE